MSLSITVVARKRISAEEKEILSAYCTIGKQFMASDMPENLEHAVSAILGFKPKYPEDIDLDDDFAEINIDCDVIYGDGIVTLSDLPAGTEQLRIYAS